METIVFNHKIISITRTESGTLKLLTRVDEGAEVIQLQSFNDDLRGHIAALSVAIDFLSGKIQLIKVHQDTFSSKERALLGAN